MNRAVNMRPLLRASQRCPLHSSMAARRTLFSAKGSGTGRNINDLDLGRLRNQRSDYDKNKTAFLTAGAIAGIVSFIYTSYKLKQAIDKQSEREALGVKCDAPPIPTETFRTEAGEKRKVVIHDELGNEIVPTGNSTVKAFPRIIEVDLPTDQDQPASSITASIDQSTGTEYTLVGLGMRTVTFLGIQVYLVGLYVATQDVAKLQHYLVKKVNSVATTLIPSEKDELRKKLLDPKEGEETWDSILRDAGCRSVIRISPVRDTDFHHLRDGFVRAITGRSQRDKAYNDEAFGEAMKDFKALFNRGKMPKKQEMLLCRDARGTLRITHSDAEGQKPKRDIIGTITDERISRLLWLNYLAGKSVASEPARQNIIEGVMEFVERPVGTVATQVL